MSRPSPGKASLPRRWEAEGRAGTAAQRRGYCQHDRESRPQCHRYSSSRSSAAIGKLFAAFVRRSDEGTLSRLLVEVTVLLAAARTNPAVVLHDAAATYKIDTDAIALKVKQEFAAKEKAQTAKTPGAQTPTKATNKGTPEITISKPFGELYFITPPVRLRLSITFR